MLNYLKSKFCVNKRVKDIEDNLKFLRDDVCFLREQVVDERLNHEDRINSLFAINNEINDSMIEELERQKQCIEQYMLSVSAQKSQN